MELPYTLYSGLLNWHFKIFFFLLIVNSKCRPMNESDCTVVFLKEVILPWFGVECSSTNSCISTAGVN